MLISKKFKKILLWFLFDEKYLPSNIGTFTLAILALPWLLSGANFNHLFNMLWRKSGNSPINKFDNLYITIMFGFISLSSFLIPILFGQEDVYIFAFGGYMFWHVAPHIVTLVIWFIWKPCKKLKSIKIEYLN